MFSKQVAIIADDSVQVQRIVARILKQDLNFGHVLVASNGRQALQFFESENVDWIFSDWEMPTMDGRALLETLRKHPRGRFTPFILMTGHADKETLAAAMAAGITDFVAKPFSPAILTQKVRRIAAAIERRAAARIAPKQRFPAQIAFVKGPAYAAELVDISSSGCLLRTEPLRQGGTVCDQAKLTLKLESKTVAVKATTIRIAVDNDAGQSGQYVQVAFQFQASDAALNAIKLFITQQQAQESVPAGDAGELIA